MARSCEQALAIGLPAVAFTEHLEFTEGGEGDAIAGVATDARWWTRIKPLDVTGYLASVADCRERFPGLRILSGVETGESHLFAASAGAVVHGHHFDRVLGSLHTLAWEGRLVNSSSLFQILEPADVMRRYLAEVAALVEGSDAFEILAHLDYPRRHWPASAGRYPESGFEEEYRAVLRALASSGRVLEVNTLSPMASVTLLGWWRDVGGRAVSFGSDAHVASRVADRFREAVQIAEAAGFRRGRDAFDFWRC